MTPRASLRERVGKAREARYVDLPVPDLEGVYVRYRALRAEELEANAKSASKRKDSPAVLVASVATLVDACLGVYEVRDGEGVSVVEDDAFDGAVNLETGEVSGTLPTFSDVALGEEVGAEPGRAGNVVLALYSTDGDVIGTADAVITHSGRNGEELLREARGN